MSDTYNIFIPSARQGLAVAISESADEAHRAQIDITLRATARNLDTGQDEIESTMPVQLYGPGDVLGFDPRIVVRTDPRPDVGDFEPNYFPAIEFADPDFVWRFTAKSAEEGETGKLIPWITLIVLVAESWGEECQKEFEEGAKSDRNLPPYITVVHSALPDLEHVWHWGHVHITGEQDLSKDDILNILHDEPERAVCRLLCPRRLCSKTRYAAFVVPTFKLGVLAGLGLDLDPNISALEPAWRGDESGPVELPYYYGWEFQTGMRGDFEHLVRLLEPRKLSGLGTRHMDCEKPGYGVQGVDRAGIDAPDKHYLGLEGALQSLDTQYTRWGRDPAEKPAQTPEPLQKDLTNLINGLYCSFDIEETDAINNIAIAALPSGGTVRIAWHTTIKGTSHIDYGKGIAYGHSVDDPELKQDHELTISGLTPGSIYHFKIVARDNGDTIAETGDGTFSIPQLPSVVPPIYGRWHAARGRVNPHDQEPWLDVLNLDPRHRAAAGLGSEVIRKQQEPLMASAWEQLGAVESANDILRRAQFGRESSNWLYQRLDQLPTEEFLRVTAPVQKRVIVEDEATGEKMSAAHYLRTQSRIPGAALDPAFRRIASRRGPIRKRQKTELRQDLMTRLASGEPVAAGPPPKPLGTTRLCDITQGLLDNLPGVSLSADPTQVRVGETSTLSWNASNCTSCWVSGGPWQGSFGCSGDKEVGPFTEPGKYTFSLTCEGPGGRVRASATVEVIPNQQPVADPNGRYGGLDDEPITFDGSRSHDPDGDPLTYNWDFGDGSTGSGVNPSHAYAIPSGETEHIYTVTLVVNDGTVDSEPASTTATVRAEPSNLPPVADPNGSYSGQVGVPITFDGSRSHDPDGDSLTYTWDFGDGNTGTGVRPSHTYEDEDTYTVTLVVNDGTDYSEPVRTTATIEMLVPTVDVWVTHHHEPYRVWVHWSSSYCLKCKDPLGGDTCDSDPIGREVGVNIGTNSFCMTCKEPMEVEKCVEIEVAEDGSWDYVRSVLAPDCSRHDPALRFCDGRITCDQIQKALQEFQPFDDLSGIPDPQKTADLMCNTLDEWLDKVPEAGTPELPTYPLESGFVDQVKEMISPAIDPGRTIVNRTAKRLHLKGDLAQRFDEGASGDPLDAVMSAPTFPQPMYEPLRDISHALLLPGVEKVPQNTIGLLQTNRRFMESYLCGCNHEFAGELLWRGYPTDQRGSYFRQFWDVSEYIPTQEQLEQLLNAWLEAHPEDIEAEKERIIRRHRDEVGDTSDLNDQELNDLVADLIKHECLEEQLKDITRLVRWRTNSLGHNKNRPGEELVLVIRGDLLKQYPNALIYAIDAVTGPNDEPVPGLPEYPDSFLFGVGLDFQSDLEAGTLSQDFRDAFQANGINLTSNDHITIVTEADDKQWRIAELENDRAYIAIKESYEESDVLNIYQVEVKPRIFPTFRATLPPDLTFFGFPFSADQARGNENALGKFFVIEERVSEARFGLDAPTEPPPEFKDWHDLSWLHFRFGIEPTNQHFGVYLDSLNLQLPPPFKDDWADASSAKRASITFQNPVRISVHAKQMLPDSAVFFEFKGPDTDDRFVIKLVQADKIEHARRILSGAEAERTQISGIVVSERAPYNPGWSYHLNPITVEFFDVAMEVCDATMRYVEEHLDEVGGAFLPDKRWCPWGSELIRELADMPVFIQSRRQSL